MHFTIYLSVKLNCNFTFIYNSVKVCLALYFLYKNSKKMDDTCVCGKLHCLEDIYDEKKKTNEQNISLFPLYSFLKYNISFKIHILSFIVMLQGLNCVFLRMICMHINYIKYRL